MNKLLIYMCIDKLILLSIRKMNYYLSAFIGFSNFYVTYDLDVRWMLFKMFFLYFISSSALKIIVKEVERFSLFFKNLDV